MAATLTLPMTTEIVRPDAGRSRVRIEIKETERLKAARAAEDAASEAYDKAATECRRAVQEAAGVIPGKTIVSWMVGQREMRGVLVEVCSRWSTRVKPIRKNGTLGPDHTRTSNDFNITTEQWEGPWGKD